MVDRCVERQLAYGGAAARYPGIAAHLSNCNPSVEDFEGLTAAIGGADGSAPLEKENDGR